MIAHSVRCCTFVALTAIGTPGWSETAAERGIRYLSREVPAWSVENQCFSCHNNGDGARALYVAKKLGYPVPDAALRGTTEWLSNPTQWKDTRTDPAFSDKNLAVIQFAAALREMGNSSGSLRRAAGMLAEIQQPDGSWRIEGESTAGSPVTYGTALATALSLQVLERAGGARFERPITRAKQWLTEHKPASILDSAAILIAGPERRALLEDIINARNSDGGWGPQRYAPSEPFDTAAVLLALRASGGSAEMIAEGRAFLDRTQLPSGGWPETTRPPGAQSYAQHVSTSAWATLALLLTDPER